VTRETAVGIASEAVVVTYGGVQFAVSLTRNENLSESSGNNGADDAQGVHSTTTTASVAGRRGKVIDLRSNESFAVHELCDVLVIRM